MNRGGRASFVVLSGAGFSLWILGMEKKKPTRLKPAPLKS
jgi:hypothetical protein